MDASSKSDINENTQTGIGVSTPSVETPAQVENAIGAGKAIVSLDATNPYLTHLPLLIAVTVGMMWGLGYAIQNALALQLQIGPVTTTRESAIGTGLGFLLFIIPCLLPLIAYRKYIKEDTSTAKSQDPPKIGKRLANLVRLVLSLLSLLLIFSIATSVVQLCAVYIPFSQVDANQISFFDRLTRFVIGPFTFSLIVNVIFLALRFTWLIDKGTRKQLWLIEVAAGVVLIPVLIQIYAGNVAPFLEPTYGGYVLNPVREVHNGKPVGPVKLIVLAGQSDVIFADVSTRQEFWQHFYYKQEGNPFLHMTRVRWENVGDLENIIGSRSKVDCPISSPDNREIIKPPVRKSGTQPLSKNAKEY